MHAYIGYYSTSVLAGPIVLCILWSNGEKTFSQIDINDIDATDVNASLLSKINYIVKSYPSHRFTVKSIFKVGRNCRCVMRVIEDDHKIATKFAEDMFKNIMKTYDEIYPGWGFSTHFGENNKLHRDILNKKRRVLPIHRKSFWPCSKYTGIEQRRKGRAQHTTIRKRKGRSVSRKLRDDYKTI